LTKYIFVSYYFSMPRLSAETGRPRYHNASKPQGADKPAGWVKDLYEHPRGGPLAPITPAKPIRVAKGSSGAISPTELLSSIDANAAKGKLSDTGMH
jgi:hypothetical protein